MQEHVFLDPVRMATEQQRLRRVINPLIWACTNPIPMDLVVERCEQIWGPEGFFVMHWDASQQPTANQAYWPCFLIEQQINQRRPVATRQHRISMLSGRVRPHRIEFWHSIRNLVRSDDVIVINRFGLDRCGFDHVALMDLPWSNRADFLDESQDRPVCTNTTAIDHPAFRACVNITAETLGPGPEIFITEKTWKALAAGCMLWHWGCDGAARYLSGLGFKDWFDHASAKTLDLFRRDDIWDFYRENEQAVLQEVEQFWSPALIRSLTQPALTQLDSWLDR